MKLVFLSSLRYNKARKVKHMPKTCSRCQEEYCATLDFFKGSNATPDGLTDYCRLCASRVLSKRWREKHPEYVREHNRQHREANPDYQKVWQVANRDKTQRADRKYKAANREKLLTKSRAWKTSHPEQLQAYREAHKEEMRAYAIAYREAHRQALRDKGREYAKNHRPQKQQRKKAYYARKKGAALTDLTVDQWERIKAHYGYRCVYCPPTCWRCKQHKHSLTQDHITPVSKGGNTTVQNIVPACHACNVRKRDRDVPIPIQPLLIL